jgi:aryl-alcohol dehydrogenase-like predicted oxidoreductase
VDFALDNRHAGERILPLARERGIAVMINLPLGRGRLFRAVRGKSLPDWAAEFDCRSWAQFFLKYILGFDAVTCVIPGMAKPEHANDNLGAGQGRLPDAPMRRRMESYIDTI